MAGWEVKLDDEDLQRLRQCRAYFCQSEEIPYPNMNGSYVIAATVVGLFVVSAIVAAIQGVEEPFFSSAFPFCSLRLLCSS